MALGILGSDDDDDDSELLVAGFFGGGAAGSAAATAAPAPLRRPGRLVTELLSAERLILLALSELDLSWPPPLADLMCLLEGPIGGVGLEGGLLREDVEYLFGFIRVFPGSLSDISFRTACGLSVPNLVPGAAPEVVLFFPSLI